MPNTERTTGGLVTFTVKVNGNSIPDEFNVFSIYAEKKVNKVASAKMVILDGDPATGEFPISSSSTFVPGNSIRIEAGYDSKNEVIFEGIITGQSIRINEEIGTVLELQCYDAAIKMTVGNKSCTYAQLKDSDIIAAIISKYEGLSSKIETTETIVPLQVQNYFTDWDYICTLAGANGLIVNTINGKIFVQTPTDSTSPVLTVSYGDNLVAFNGELNAINQLSNVKSSAWNFKDQEVNSSDAMHTISGPGNLSSKTLSEVIGLSGYELETTAPLDKEALKIWAKAAMVKTVFSKIIGELKIIGSNIPEPAMCLSLDGLGDRFNGNHFISGVKHSISDGNWFTEVSIGISPELFNSENNDRVTPASIHLQGVRGLFNGVVKKIAEDPELQYRILVNVPVLDHNGKGIWARLSNFYATNGAGVFFLPEVGDEVVLGFLNEDPRYPVVLGSMYSSPNLKPYNGLAPNEENQYKAIVSRSGISITFDDKNGELTIATPNKNTVTFSDQNKRILVQDQNGNNIILSEEGITMRSMGDIHIQSDRSVNINGANGVNINAAGGDIRLKGINLDQTADGELKMNGNAGAKLTTGAELTLKGSLVLIN